MILAHCMRCLLDSYAHLPISIDVELFDKLLQLRLRQLSTERLHELAKLI